MFSGIWGGSAPFRGWAFEQPLRSQPPQPKLELDGHLGTVAGLLPSLPAALQKLKVTNVGDLACASFTELREAGWTKAEAVRLRTILGNPVRDQGPASDVLDLAEGGTLSAKSPLDRFWIKAGLGKSDLAGMDRLGFKTWATIVDPSDDHIIEACKVNQCEGLPSTRLVKAAVDKANEVRALLKDRGLTSTGVNQVMDYLVTLFPEVSLACLKALDLEDALRIELSREDFRALGEYLMAK